MIIFTPFVLLGFFTAMVSFEKRPLIDVVLMLTICLGYTAHLNGFLKRWKMFFLLSIVFVSFAIFGILLLAPNLVISKSLLALLDRIFFGQIQSTYLYVEIFPQKHAYLGGASMIPFIYFSENPVSLARLVHEYLGMKKTVATGGSSPTIFWGEIYANFGVTPIFFVAVFLGIFLETISLIIKVIAPQAIFVIAYTWLGLYYSKIASTSFTTFIIDLKFIYTIFTLLFLRHCTAPNLKDLYSKDQIEVISMFYRFCP